MKYRDDIYDSYVIKLMSALGPKWSIEDTSSDLILKYGTFSKVEVAKAYTSFGLLKEFIDIMRTIKGSYLQSKIPLHLQANSVAELLVQLDLI